MCMNQCKSQNNPMRYYYSHFIDDETEAQKGFHSITQLITVAEPESKTCALNYCVVLQCEP